MWLVKLWDVSKRAWVWDRLGSEGCEVLEDIKSRVLRLLREIDKEIKKHDRLRGYEVATQEGLLIAKRLVEKEFEDLIKS